MTLHARLRSLEEAAWRRRPPPTGGMPDPGSELMSLFTIDRPSASIIIKWVMWADAPGLPGAGAHVRRLHAVIAERIERMRALGWPREGLGDDPPEAHEEVPPIGERWNARRRPA